MIRGISNLGYICPIKTRKNIYNVVYNFTTDKREIIFEVIELFNLIKI